MFQTFKNTWALLFGVSVLFLGSGMLYTLMVVRGTQEGFSSQAMGVMQSSYQVGWLLAALLIPALIRSVGHIRVFAAVAAMGSGIILTHLLLINPWVWSVERLFMGVCTAGLMIVSESWLNDMSDNQSRGRILAVYTILSWGAPVIGVYFLRYGDVNSSFFFLVASILLSVGAIPILLSASRTPEFIEVERFNIRKLYRITPVGVTGVFMSGMVHGAFFATVSIYALAAGMNVQQTATLNAIALGGGIFLQWPIAMLSDRIDRRIVLIVTSLLAGIPAIMFGLKEALSVQEIYIAIACFSATGLGLYSQCIAHANDHLEPSQTIAATGTLVLTYGIGFAIAPIIASAFIDQSPNNFYFVNGVLAIALALFVIYRTFRRRAVEDQSEMIPVATISPYSSVISAADEWSDDQPPPQDNALEYEQQTKN